MPSLLTGTVTLCRRLSCVNVRTRPTRGSRRLLEQEGGDERLQRARRRDRRVLGLGRPPALPPPQDALGDHLAAIAELDDHDLELVTAFIYALVTKTRLKHRVARAS